MKEYEFVLKFRLPEATTDPEAFVGQLAEAGCDDALVGIGQTGRIALDFARESPSAIEAIASAIKDVKRAIPEAQLIEATPDLVGLTDVADILGFSRQNMRKLVLKYQDFPPPLHEGKPSIWHLAKILHWLDQKKTYTVNLTLLEIADANMQFNIAREAQTLEPSIQSGLKALLA